MVVVDVVVVELEIVEGAEVETGGGGGGGDLGVADDAISSSCTGARTLQTQEGLLACFLKWTNKNRCALNKETKKKQKMTKWLILAVAIAKERAVRWLVLTTD